LPAATKSATCDNDQSGYNRAGRHCAHPRNDSHDCP
jgi:hypothetical protein